MKERLLIEILTIYRENLEDRAWQGISSSEIIKAILFRLRKRTATTTFIPLRNSNDPKDHEWEKETKKLLKKEEAILTINLEALVKIPDNWDIQGAKLQVLTTNEIYKFVKERFYKVPKQSTRHIKIRQDAIQRALDINQRLVTDEEIWTELRKSKLSNSIKDFIWKTRHDVHRCGAHFAAYAPEMQYCKCAPDCIEDINHILFECPLNCGAFLWEEIEKIWDQEYKIHWISPDIDILRALPVIEPIMIDNEYDRVGIAETYRMLVASGAWSIWKARNDRCINDAAYSGRKLLNQWLDAIRTSMITEWTSLKWLEPHKRIHSKERFEKAWCTNGTFAKIINNKIKVVIKQHKMIQIP
ncbi:hypothetical protein IW261DRAFT_1352857 [Armillaria novae-zelandiae]|uniref:Reverse transcriptase zinc-binding domain-containing protein n=1 Tax=Armillaria novae-zelandiae TaxID=153914 RepID=A0AA39N5N5_9AGAR|nr:hypothetical protein IW261DRAFT_1352857 [Armillaria novae-zelandiae]